MTESLFPQQRPGGLGAAQHRPLITFKLGSVICLKGRVTESSQSL
jgi:hypothetical protein